MSGSAGVVHMPGMQGPLPRRAPSVGVIAGVVVGLALLAAGAFALWPQVVGVASDPSAGQASVADLAPPMRFEANAGQTHSEVDFLARGSNYDLFLTPSAAVVSLPATDDEPAHGIHLGFVGADPEVEPAGVDALSGSTNYISGDSTVTEARGFGAVDYQELYPGIDLRFHERGEGGLEYLFTVAPGADPETIGLSVEGAEPTIDTSGDLILSTPAGELRQSAPVLYQDIDGTRHQVTGEFTLRDNNEVGFAVGDYNPNHPLIIDPVIDYATYVGGTGRDGPTGVVVDDESAAYVTGYTTSPDFPTTPGAYQESGTPGQQDVYAAKFTSDGSDLEWATYLSGSQEDTGSAVAVDDAGAVYVTGRTQSEDFPTTTGALQENFQGGATDAFAAKLSPDGGDLEYSTYLGGNDSDAGFGIAVRDGAAHVTGTSSSTDLPTTAGALAETHPGGDTNGFTSKLDPDGSALNWSTYLGGSADDTASGVHVDTDGNVYLVGDSRSPDIPTTAGAYQENNPSDTCPADDEPDRLCESVYTLKLDEAGNQQLGTYFGGEGDESAGAPSRTGDASQNIDVAADGSVLLVGGTESADFPLSAGALQTRLPTGEEHDGEARIGFVTRLNPEVSDLVYSTFLGGRRPVDNVDVADDGTATVAMTAETDAIPTHEPVERYTSNHDNYVGRINPQGTELVFGSHLGGRKVDLVRGMTVGPDGSAYVIGDTQSDEFPTTPGAFATTPPGGLSGHLTRVSPTPENAPLVTGVAPRSGPEDGGTEVEITGRDLSGASAVQFGNEAAEDFTVESDGRITATSPPGSDTVHVTVTTPEGTSPPNPIAEFTYAQGVWETTGDMATIRFDASLTLLDDGRVLAAGGRTEIRGGETVETAEIYDPVNGEWTDTAAISEPRSHHSATLLPDGRVLVAGGFGEDGSTGLASAEVFDPDTGTWSTTDALSEARGRHLGVSLDDGRVLVTGGQTGSRPATHRASAEVYDPDTDSWETTGAMGQERANFAGDVLDDGRVLVAGGDPLTATAEVYDPDAGTWEAVASMTAERSQHQGTTLDDGRVLMASGLAAGRSAEVYDPDTDEWTASAMIHDRWTALLGKLPDGQVMLAGGTDGGPYAELYQPDSNNWTSAGVMHRSRPSWRNGHRNDLILLSSDPDTFEADPEECGDHCGKLLAAGNTITRVTELYSPEGPEEPPAEEACPDGQVPTADFVDRDDIPQAHRPNVDCAAWHDILAGFEDGTYRPALPVRRDQMATFIAGMLAAGDVDLPEPVNERFNDVAADSVHDEAIHRLAAADIILGGPEGLDENEYGPGLRIRRDQMASFLLRAAEFATNEDLTSQTQAFDDVPEGNVHFANVNGAAEAGFAQGFGDGTYRPASDVRRDQMASFVIRVLKNL